MALSKKQVILDIVLALLLFAAGYQFLTYKIWIGFNRYDEGAHYYGAWMLSRGTIPFLDVHHIYPPGRGYIVSWICERFGWEILSIRRMAAGFSSLNCVLVFLFASRLSRRPYAFGAWALSMAYFYEFFSPGMMILVFFLCASHFRKPSIVKVFLAGLVIGIITWCRQDFGFYACVAAIPTFVFWSFGSPGALSGFKRLVRAIEGLGFMALGVIVVLLPLGVLYLTIAYEEFITAFIKMPAVTTRLRAMPYPRPWGPLDAFRAGQVEFGAYLKYLVFSAWPYYTPFLIVALSLVGLALRRRGVRSWTPWDYTHLYTAFLVLCLFNYARVVSNLWHLVPMALFSTILIAPVAMDAVMLFRANKRLLPALMAALIVIVVISDGGIVVVKVLKLRSLDREYSELGLPHATGIKVEPDLAADYRRAVNFIKSHTRRNERVYVGLLRHDLVAANDVLFSFLAERVMPTRYFHFDPGVQTAAEVQEEMIWGLKVHKVRYVVLWAYLPEEHLMRKNMKTDGSLLLDAYLKEHFRTEINFGEYFILKRVKR